MPAKPGIHTRPDCFIHAMPAYVQELEVAGLKWVSGYPPNSARGLPYITGLLVLNDWEDGGRPDLAARAQAKLLGIIAEHQPAPLDDATKQRVSAIVDRLK